MFDHDAFAGLLRTLDRLDPEDYRRLHIPDFHFAMPGVALDGGEEYLALVSGWASAFPDLSHELLSFISQGNAFAAVIRISGTHEGDFPAGDTVLPGTGRRFAVETATHGTFDGGQLATRRAWFDPAELVGQLTG